jgi:hypothetical protein
MLISKPLRKLARSLHKKLKFRNFRASGKNLIFPLISDNDVFEPDIQ